MTATGSSIIIIIAILTIFIISCNQIERGNGTGDFETPLHPNELSIVNLDQTYCNCIINFLVRDYLLEHLYDLIQVASAHSAGGMLGAAVSGLFLLLAKKIGHPPSCLSCHLERH